MDVPSREFVLAGSLEELKAKGRLVLHGGHRPILVIHDRGRVFVRWTWRAAGEALHSRHLRLW